MEILGVKNGYFNVFSVFFQCDFGWNQVKCARLSPLSLFLQFFCRYSLYFLQGEINSGGGRNRKISAPYQPPYQRST